MTTATERFRYHRALHALLEQLARERPVALLLDDLHWADEATLGLVLHLLRRPPEGPFLLAFALRPGERADRLLATPGWHLPAARAAARRGGTGAARRGAERKAARTCAARGGRQSAVPARARARGRSDRSAGHRRGGRAAGAWRGSTHRRASCSRVPPSPVIRSTPSWRPPPPASSPTPRCSTGSWPRSRSPDRHGPAFEFRHPLVRRAVYDAPSPAGALVAHERVAARPGAARRRRGGAGRSRRAERAARRRGRDRRC